MKRITRIFYKDKSVGFEADGMSLVTVGGEVDRKEIVEDTDENIKKLLKKPDKFDVRKGRVVARKKKVAKER